MREHDGSDRPRPSSRAVVAGAVLALALGGWWWVSHPPAPTPGRAPGSTPASRALPFPLPLPAPLAGELRAEVVVPEPDPSAGMLVPGPEGDTWRVRDEPTFLDAERTVALIPSAEDAVLRTGVELAPGERYLHDGPAPAGNYLLEVACLGDGILVVTVTLPDNGYTLLRLACDGRVAELELTYRPGYTAIELAPSARTRLDAAFQISRS